MSGLIGGGLIVLLGVAIVAVLRRQRRPTENYIRSGDGAPRRKTN